MRITEVPNAFQALETIMRDRARKTVPERKDSPLVIANELIRVYIDRATDVADSVSVEASGRDGRISYFGIVSDRVTVKTEEARPVSVVFGNREQTLEVSDGDRVIFQRVDVRV